MRGRKQRRKRRRRGQRETAKGIEQQVAITEQLTDSGLYLESQPWARYATAGGLVRMITVLIRRWKKKRLGEWVPPLPWSEFLLAAVIFLGIAGAAFGIAWLATH